MDTYGFTTDSEDTYFDRILAEASPETNIIVTTERNTVADEGNNAALVAIRKNALLQAALIVPYETFAGRELHDILVETIERDADEATKAGEIVASGTDWVIFQGTGNDAEIATHTETARHEARRIINVLNGRVVRVTVESY
jgi:hypothetical protein